MRIGIIGSGTIASAIVTGFCTKNTAHEFFLSPRGAEKAATLASRFAQAKVCLSNQEVLDKVEWVFITVQKNAFAALRELRFKAEHKVLNMATEMPLDELKQITGTTALLAHVVPLPMIVRGFGPLLVYPEISEVGELFAPVSQAVYLQKMSDIPPLQLLTCIMSPYYMLLEEFVRFSEEQGVEHDVAVQFTHSLFSALSRRAAETPHCDLIELANDMTPGGYNEQSMNELTGNGAIAAWRTALEHLLERLKGNS